LNIKYLREVISKKKMAGVLQGHPLNPTNYYQIRPEMFNVPFRYDIGTGTSIFLRSFRRWQGVPEDEKETIQSYINPPRSAAEVMAPSVHITLLMIYPGEDNIVLVDGLGHLVLRPSSRIVYSSPAYMDHGNLRWLEFEITVSEPEEGDQDETICAYVCVGFENQTSHEKNFEISMTDLKENSKYCWILPETAFIVLFENRSILFQD
jgi:hypothetical protein